MNSNILSISAITSLGHSSVATVAKGQKIAISGKSAVAKGQSPVAEPYKGEYKTILILEDVDLFVGVDGLNYLLHRQDVAHIPAVHARNLIRSGHAVEINPGLGPHPRREAGA